MKLSAPSAERKILVIPGRGVKGWDGRDDLPPTRAKDVPFEAALRTAWETDAHFMLYAVHGADGRESKTPRLCKVAEPAVMAAGAEVLVEYIALDWDIPYPTGQDHVPWDAELWDEFQGVLGLAEAVSPLVRDQWSAFYTTMHGVRWVYVLAHPVTTREGEEIARGMVRHFKDTGLDVDPLTDWTRLMRLPSVKRGAARTEEGPFFMLQVHTIPVDPKSLPHHVKDFDDQYGTAEAVDEGFPGQDAPKLLLISESGKGKSRWYHQAKKVLDDWDIKELVFGTEPLELTEGGRGLALFRLAGQLCKGTIKCEDATPEGLYALMLAKVELLPYDDGWEGETWAETWWRAVVHAWTRESAKKDQEAWSMFQAQEERAVEAKSLKKKIVAGVKAWFGMLPPADNGAWEFIEPRLMLIAPTGTHIMLPSGCYSEELKDTSLVPAISRYGMDSVIDLWIQLKESYKPAKPQELRNKYGTPVRRHRALIGDWPGATATGYHKPIVDSVDSHPFALDPAITGRRDERVAQWLNFLCATPLEHERLLEWIAHSFDFAKPIPMLVLTGASGSGKQMVMRGLAENMCQKSYGDFAGAIGDFPDQLLESPFLGVIEGFPIQPRTGLRLADAVRKLISGDEHRVNIKYQQPSIVSVNYRVVVTANNDGGLMGLYRNHDLGPDDREAIISRIVYIRASRNAAAWLRRQGGHVYTKGWVGGQGPSQYIVARHFRYLYENRAPSHTVDGRFLVDPLVPSEKIDEMATSTGGTPEVLEAIYRLLEENTNPEGLYLVQEDQLRGVPAGIYVTSHAVRGTLPTNTKLDIRRVGRLMMNLSHSTHSIQGNHPEGRFRHHRLNVPMLYRNASQTGRGIPRILSKFAALAMEAEDQ